MRHVTALQVLFVASALAQHTSSEHYDRVCFSLDDRTEQIIPGYTVRYKCDAYGPHDGHRIPASTPKDCALKCESTQGCQGSSWLSDQNQCVLSGEQPSGIRRKTIYMKKVEVDPFAEGDDPFGLTPEEAIKQCKKDQQSCTTQLARCNNQQLQDQQDTAAHLGACESRNLEEQKRSSAELGECKQQNIRDQQQCAIRLSSCETEKLQAQQEAASQLNQYKGEALREKAQSAIELSNCKDQALADKKSYSEKLNTCGQKQTTLPNDNIQCDHGRSDSAEIKNYNGKRFAVWCQRFPTGGEYFDLASLEPGTTLAQCVAKCSLIDNCHVVSFRTDSGTCGVYNRPLNVPWTPLVAPRVDRFFHTVFVL